MSMATEDIRDLYRDRYDLLTMERRERLLRLVAEECGMKFLGTCRFDRWGISTFTAEYEMDGIRFVFVPGDDVETGWAGTVEDLDLRTRRDLEAGMVVDGFIGTLQDFIRSRTVPRGSLRIPPMVVETAAKAGNVIYDEVRRFLPDAAEWEYLCSGGRNTLYAWGDGWDYAGTEKVDAKNPNFFGLVIGEDPFGMELIRSDAPEYLGGDGGSRFFRYGSDAMRSLSCTPHYRPESVIFNPEELFHRIRRVYRLDPELADDGAIAEESRGSYDGPPTPDEPGPDTVFDSDKPFTPECVSVRDLIEDPDVPEPFADRIRHILRSFSLWLPRCRKTYAEIADRIYCMAEDIEDEADRFGFTLTPRAACNIIASIEDILGFYDIRIDAVDATKWSELAWQDEHARFLDDLLFRCGEWHEAGEYQRIIDELETIPEYERTPEVMMELARAYIDVGRPPERKHFLRAVDILRSIEDEMGDGFLWNYCLGYALICLDREGEARMHLRRALEIEPDDAATMRLIDACDCALTFQIPAEPFLERSRKAWEFFSDNEPRICMAVMFALDGGDPEDAIRLMM